MKRRFIANFHFEGSESDARHLVNEIQYILSRGEFELNACPMVATGISDLKAYSGGWDFMVDFRILRDRCGTARGIHNSKLRQQVEQAFRALANNASIRMEHRHLFLQLLVSKLITTPWFSPINQTVDITP